MGPLIIGFVLFIEFARIRMGFVSEEDEATISLFYEEKEWN